MCMIFKTNIHEDQLYKKQLHNHKVYIDSDVTCFGPVQCVLI